MSKIKFHAFALILIIFICLAGAMSMKPLTASERVKCDFRNIPLQMNGMLSTDQQFSPDTYSQLGSSSLLLRKYDSHGADEPIELAIVYGVDLGDFHQPEFCLGGQGLRVLRTGVVKVKGTDGKPFDAVSLVTESDYGSEAFIYWFYSEGTSATSLGNYKMKLLINRLKRRQIVPSAMIRLSTSIHDSPDAAIEHLARFADKLVPYLDEELGGSNSR